MTIFTALQLKKRTRPLMAESWLQDPSGAWTMRFHRDPDSWIQFPWYFIDICRLQVGCNISRKDRQHLARTDAVKLWNELRKDGWKKVEAQW